MTDLTNLSGGRNAVHTESVELDAEAILLYCFGYLTHLYQQSLISLVRQAHPCATLAINPVKNF